ncbi:uncharacterized protein CXorf38 homolog [Engraulis encrasicolus]|uniref:uncharacterized protein CXorf38 homolog n=1 Tax=Engraulis encrasicolus TaxID=184585 RepID=UPI002FD4BE93
MSRFYDDNYRNWLKTTESLNALRVGLRSFVENETETYHGSLKSKLGSKDAVCRIKCDGKQWQNKRPDQIPKCEVCTRWKALILANHKSATGYGVYWKECFPHLWPTEKWEVAKVYMPQGHRDHRCFDQFDIAALMVLMSNCKHFRTFVKDQQRINKVTRVRNRVMHSPDFTLVQDDFQLFLSTIKEFALLLQEHAHDLKTLPQEIDKMCEIVDNGIEPATL